MESTHFKQKFFKEFHNQAHFVKDNKNETSTLIDFTFLKFFNEFFR